MSTTKPWLAHYEADVPPTMEIPEIPLQQLLRDSAQKYGDKVALRLVLKYLPLGLTIQSRLTYRELDTLTDRFAAALHGLGIGKGDRVAIMLPNLPQHVIAYFGTLKAGATVVNTNPTYTPRELQHQLHDSGAKVIVMLSGLYDRLARIREHTSIENVILTDVPDTLGWPFNKLTEKQVRASGMMVDMPEGPDVYRFYPLLERTSARPPATDDDLDSAVLFQYSGGTTDVPKAAMLSHRNLVSNVFQMDAWFSNIEHGREKILGALPFFHVYGMTVGMLLCVAAGGELVIVPDPRNRDHILEVIDRERITLYPGVPAMYTALINHAKVQDYDLHSIKACLSGGSALPVEVSTQFEKITGGKLVEGYGLSESSPVATANPILGQRKTGSIGVPISNTNVRIVSLEADADGNYAEVPLGEEGELVIEGPQVMLGYWNMPEETKLTIDKTGALHTGDIAKMDEDGYFYIVDRKKDLIIASGYNVVPREVEEVLFMHPKVMEAAVAGVPDPKRGETVKAFVVLKDGQTCTVDEIRAFCKENLAPYKVPTAVDFRDELPKTQVGKVLRRLLVEEEIAKMEKEKAAA